MLLAKERPGICQLQVLPHRTGEPERRVEKTVKNGGSRPLLTTHSLTWNGSFVLTARYKLNHFHQYCHHCWVVTIMCGYYGSTNNSVVLLLHFGLGSLSFNHFAARLWSLILPSLQLRSCVFLPGWSLISFSQSMWSGQLAPEDRVVIFCWFGWESALNSVVLNFGLQKIVWGVFLDVSRRCNFVFLLLLGWSFAFFAAWGWKETADSGKCGGGGNLCLPVKVEDNGKKVKQESTIQNVCNFHLFFHHWLNAKRSLHGKWTVKNGLWWTWLGLKTLSVDGQKCHPTCTLYTTISDVQKWWK